MYNESDLAVSYSSGYEAAAEDLYTMIVNWDGPFTPTAVCQAIEDILAWAGDDEDVSLDDFELDEDELDVLAEDFDEYELLDEDSDWEDVYEYFEPTTSFGVDI